MVQEVVTVSRRVLVGMLVWVLVLSACAEPKAPASPTPPAPGEPYSDVRNMDLRNLASLDPVSIATLTFNEATIWPEQYKGAAHDILEQGKNRGWVCGSCTPGASPAMASPWRLSTRI